MKYDAVNKIIIIKKDIRNLIWLQLYFTATYGFLRDIIGLPSSITYLLDALLVIMAVYSILMSRLLGKNTKQYYILFGIIMFFFLTTICGFMLNGYSSLLYLWGFRNTFRFYIFFFICAIYFQQEDLIKFIKFFKRIFYLNVVAATLEFLLGFQGDYIGGLFGIESGGNGDLNLIMVIITTITAIQYLAKKIGLVELSSVIFCCLYLMAIAELKVYLFELPFIVAVAILNEKFTIRKLGIIILIIIGFVVGITMLGFFFPTSGIEFFTTDTISRYMGDNGYTGQGDFNRFNAVMKSQELFFGSNLVLSLLGLGLGNCSYSGFDWLTSEFYLLFQDLHYQWFADSMIFLETGWIGLIIFEGFFVILFFISIINKNKFKKDSVEYTTIKCTTILSLCCIILSVYNITLKMESSYLIYGFMATVLVVIKKNNKKITSNFSKNKNK